jgi:hypothetical protein
VETLSFIAVLVGIQELVLQEQPAEIYIFTWEVVEIRLLFRQEQILGAMEARLLSASV